MPDPLTMRIEPETRDKINKLNDKLKLKSLDKTIECLFSAYNDSFADETYKEHKEEYENFASMARVLTTMFGESLLSIDKANESLNRQKANNEKLKQENTNLKSSERNLIQHFGTIESENSDLQSNFDKLKSENEALNNRLTELSNEAEQKNVLHSDLQMLKDTISSKDAELISLKSQLEDCEREKNTIEDEKSKLTIEHKILSDRYEKDMDKSLYYYNTLKDMGLI